MNYNSQALDDLLSKLHGVTGNHPQWMARCPAHDDSRPSLSISIGNNGKPLVHCHAGCSQKAVIAALKKLGAWPHGKKKPKLKKSVKIKKPIHFIYRDEDGNDSYRITRTAGKNFCVSRSNGEGGWIKGLGDMKQVPYRLDEFKNKKWIYVVEGEKDADALWEWGIPATTNPFGAGKWKEELNKYFENKHVRIIPDNDLPGQEHGLDIAENLFLVAKSVKIIPLDVGEKGDFSDWKAAGGTKEQFKAIVKDIKRLTKAELQEQMTKVAKSPEALLFDKGRRLTQKGFDKHDELADLLKIWRDEQKFDLSDQKVDEIAAAALANKPPWHIGDLFQSAGFDSLGKKPPIDEVRECLRSLGRSLLEVSDSECTTWCRQEFNRRSSPGSLDIKTADRLFDDVLERLRFDIETHTISSIQTAWAAKKPWEKPVDLGKLLVEIVELLEEYFALPSKSVAHFLAVWSVASFVYDQFYVFPYIAIHSPEGGCGKTNLMDTIGFLASHTKKAGSITASSLFRYAHALHPTFLMDELTKNKLRQNEELRTIINLGHASGGVKTVSEPGPTGGFFPVDYNVFCPKVMAGVGDYLAAVDDTTNTRSIHIEMKKALPEEAEQLLDFEILIRGTIDLEVQKKCLPLHRKILRWTNDHKKALLNADDPKFPKGVINRDKTNWRPILKITEMAEGKWPQRGRMAARRLCGVPEAQRDDYRQMLLEDLKTIMEEHPEEKKGFWTRELIGTKDKPEGYLLKEKFASHPWQSYGRGGRPINAKQLSELLKQDIAPRAINKENREGKVKNLNGYNREELEMVIKRSLVQKKLKEERKN